MLSPLVSGRLHDLIDDSEFHCSLPVNIEEWAAVIGWTVEFDQRMRCMYGVAIVYKHVWRMAINDNIDRVWQRVAIAHEMSHLIAGHKDTLYTMQIQPLWNTKQELEAEAISAELLIPEWTLRAYRTVREVAVACDVPEDLVIVRLRSTEWE